MMKGSRDPQSWKSVILQLAQATAFLALCFVVAQLHVDVHVKIEVPPTQGADAYKYVAQINEYNSIDRTNDYINSGQTAAAESEPRAFNANRDAINHHDSLTLFAEKYNSFFKNTSSAVFRALQKRESLCIFNISWSRSDHPNGQIFRTITVGGVSSDVFMFDFRCDWTSLDAQTCVQKYDAGVNYIVREDAFTEDNPFEIVAIGTCCTVDGYIAEQAPPHQPAIPNRVRMANVVSNDRLNMPSAPRENPLTIFVLTCCRAQSLQRLLNSLKETYFDNDRVDLKVMIDKPRSENTHNDGVVAVTAEFDWPYGNFTVHKHSQNVGLVGQWVHSWHPDREERGLAAFFEDDIVVSKFWYRWATKAHHAYINRTDIVGYTLQRANLNASGGNYLGGGPMGEVNFLYRLVGTWGLVLRPQEWRQFRSWYSSMRANISFKPYSNAAQVHTSWYKSFEKAGTAEERMWSMWIIKFCEMENKYFLYTKCSRGKTLGSNMAEPGLNYASKGAQDFLPMVIEDLQIYAFPESPIKLEFNGLPETAEGTVQQT